MASSPSAVHADDDHAGIAYGIASAELATGGAIAIHAFTASTPGEGIGLAVNFLPLAVGLGMGIVAETQDLDPRPALGLHGGVIGGMPMMMIGASFDGRGEHSGVKLGLAAITLGTLGAVGGAWYSAVRVDNASEASAVAVAPFVGAFAGSLVFAVVHFFDDRGPSSTGRLLRFAGAGMLIGTLGSFAYAYEDRSDGSSVLALDRPRMFSIGGGF